MNCKEMGLPKTSKLVFGRYDYAAFFTFAAYAAASLAIPISLVAMAQSLGFPLDSGGMSHGGALQMSRSLSMCAAMVACGFIAAKIGNRRTVALAVCVMGAGIMLCATARSFSAAFGLILICGVGEGLVEGIGTPFVQELHDKEQGRYVNFTHGFWSFGVLVSVIIFGALIESGVSWRMVLLLAALFSLPSALLLLLPTKTVQAENCVRKSSRQVLHDVREIVRTPRFWLYFCAMFFAGGGEFCLTFWSASFIQMSFGGSALASAFGAAFFAGGMLLGRTGAGAMVRQEHLTTLTITLGVAAAVVTLLIPPFAIFYKSFPPHLVLPTLFILLFVCGVCAAPFWPSIQSVAVDKMPQNDSTMIFVALSCAGVPGCGVITWIMGILGDRVGFALSFLLAPVCFLLMSAFVAVAEYSSAHRRLRTARSY